MSHKATHVAALLNAAGIAAAVVGGNEIAVIDVDEARQVLRRLTDHQHDELGIVDREGTHVALIPVKTLPPSPPRKISAPALPISDGRS